MSVSFQHFRLSLVERPPGLFGEGAAAPTREEFIRTVFAKPWSFEHYNSVFHYVPDDEIKSATAMLGRIGRAFESDENLAPEYGLQATVHRGWKAAVAVIDPRHHADGQKVLMNHDSLVGKPFPLLTALVKKINDANILSRYVMEIEPIFDADSFFLFASENKGDITRLTFQFAVPNMFGGSDTLSTWLRDIKDKESAQRVTLQLASEDGLNTETEDVREAVDYSKKGGGRVKAKTRKGRKFDSKNRAKTVALDRKNTDGTLLERVARELTKLVSK